MDFPQISPDKSHLKLFILYNNRLFYFFNVNHVQLMKGSSCLELISCWVLVGTWYQMEPRSNQSTKASPPPPTQGRDWVTEVGGNSSMSLEEGGERGA